MKKIFALVDCNSFYCSCERVFNPKLNNKPIIVLSNNDGCAVSRTDEAKALGIKMGAVYFQIKDLVKKHNVSVFSSNYTLYGDMSNRVMTVLSTFTPDMEIYSIDEAFLSFNGMEHFELFKYSKEIRSTVLQYTGIPTCVGIGPTKVLAKLANNLAKKDKIQTQGIFDLCDEDLRKKIFKTFPVQDIWGIGRQSAKKLESYKIKTAHDLIHANPEFIKKILTVVGARITEELRGTSCIDLETDIEDRKQIISSRSFGRQVTHLSDLEESVSNHITTASEKLRHQDLICKNLTVYIQTNPFKNTQQYSNSASIHLMSGTASTNKLIGHAIKLLRLIYKEKYEYKKCGIILNDLTKKDFLQTDLFNNHDSVKDEALMKVMDQINKNHGSNTLKFAICGIDHFWKMQSEMKSACYTTRWNDLLKV